MFNPGNLCYARFACILVLEWGQIKGIIDRKIDVNVDPLEISWRQVVPHPNGFANALWRSTLLNPVVADISFHNAEMLIELSVLTDREIIRFVAP